MNRVLHRLEWTFPERKQPLSSGVQLSCKAYSREYQYDGREFGLTSAMAFARQHAIQSPCLMTSCTFQGNESHSIIVGQTQAVLRLQ